MECNDSDSDVITYNFQWWPEQSGSFMDNIHLLDQHYERRIMEVPLSIRGQELLEYTSAAACVYNYSKRDVAKCLRTYSDGMNGLPGIGAYGWSVLAFMDHITDNGCLGEDHDPVV